MAPQLDTTYCDCNIELCFTKGKYEHDTAYVTVKTERNDTGHTVTSMTLDLNLTESIITILKAHYNTDVEADMQGGVAPEEGDEDYVITREDDLIWVHLAILPTTGATTQRSHDLCIEEPFFSAVSNAPQALEKTTSKPSERVR